MSDRTNAFDDMDFSDITSESAPVATANKKKKSVFDDMDFSDVVEPSAPKKPFTGRGTIAARNAAAAVQPLSERGTEFQRYAAIDANTVPSLGTAESRDRFSAEVARKAGEMGIKPELSGLSPEVRASMERVAPSGQLLPLIRNPEVVAAKFRQGWRGMDAGLAALEYNITGRITVGDNTGDALERSIGGGPTVLEGAAAEKYLRELSSPNADDSTARAFDTVSSMGTRAAANAFAQPESILSLAGGMFGGGWGSAAGMLPTAVKALGSEYQQNLKMGATHQAAFANALAKMGIDGGTEWLGGKYGGAGGPVRSMATESGEEALAQVGGYGVDALSGLLADNGTPFYEKIPKTFGKALEQTAEAAATGGIAAGALRAITAAPSLALSGAQAARDLLKSKRASSPSAVPRPRAQPMSVDNWKDRDARPIPAPMDITANISPATGSAATSPIAVDAGTGSVTFDPTINAALATPTPPPTPPPATSTLLRQIMTPEELALHESLQDEAGRAKMLADIKADAEAKRAGHDKKRAAMARNAEDTAWLAANPITSHPMFGEIDKAIRGGATSHALLKEKVPHLSGVVQRAAFTHLESIGVIGPYVKGKKREILQPQAAPTAAPAASGTIENNIVPPVQPAIQQPVQSDNIVSTQNNNVEQKSVLTLPEVGRIIARETEDVNTPPVTPTATVQTTTQDAGLTPQTKARRAKKPTPVEVPVTPQEPVAAVPATPVAAPVVEETVAPPVQAQTPVEEAPLPATIGSAAAPESVNRPALDTWVVSADPEDVDIWKGTHDAHAKRNNVKPEDTYVGQVLRGITPTAAPTVDDATFAEKMKLSIPTATPSVPAEQAATTNAPAAPPVQAEVPVTGLTPQTKARRKAAAVPVVEETVVTETPPAKPTKEPKKSKVERDLEKKAAAREAKRVADEETAKADAAREALKMPSDAELVGAGLSPAEVTLLKKNPEQHRDVLDAVSRGEISTKEGMRPVTDADVTAAKTRPEKDKLQRLKDKYEQVTDAPRKLSPASITNVRKEAIARAYERIKLIAQSPNMGQFDAIPNDPESTKAILGLQAEAQKTPTTEAELAKKLEDTYVENYTRNHPEAKEAAATPAVEAAPVEVAAPVVASPVPAGVFVHDDGGVFATAGVSESLRGLTSMWRDILKIGQKVYLTTFADLEANKGAFTGEYARILSLNSGYSRSGAGRDGVKAVLPDGSYIIVLNPKLSTSQTLEVLGHELGHAHQEIAFDNADDSTKSKLYAAYDAWARANAQPTNLAKDMLLSRAPRSQGRKIGATAKPGMTVGQLSNPTYWRSFNEWYADQVARWATTTAVPLTAVEKFFSRLGMAMRTFFNKAHNAKYLPDPRFSAYMDAVTKTAKASPTLDNQPGTVSNIEESASTVTPTPVEKPLTDTENGVGSLNRIGDAIVGLARNRGIASPEAQDMIEARSGLIEAMRVEGESAIEQVKQEMVDALRGASKATRETYKENLLKYLNGDTTVPLPAALKARIAELRKLIDDRSLALIALGLVEKDKIATVLENIGKWTHRDFKVFNLQPGRNNHPGEYKKLVMKLAKQGRRDIVKEVIDDIVEAMRVPDATTLKGLIKAAKDKKHKDHEDAKATIDTWARRWRLAYTTTPKELHAKLLAISAMDEAELKRHAVEYANYLLDPEHENAPAEVREDFNRFKAIYADDTALTKDRTQVPPWLKKLWGEYSDWETIGLLSLENQAQILAKYTTLSRYKATLLASGRAFKSDSSRSKVGYSLLEGKSYGPLNGYYIPSTDLWLIQSANTVNALDVALGARERGGNSLQATVRRMAAGTVAVTSAVGSPFKVAAVLMNHTTVLINAGISALFLAGTVPRIMSSLKAIPNGFKIARSSSFADVGIRTARTGPFKGVGMIGRALENGTELQRQLLFLVANNVLHDAALSADMKRKTQEQLTQEVDAMLTFSTRLAKYYANPFHYYRYLKDRTSRLNSAGDEFGKYIMWASRVENLMAIDPQMSQVDAELLAAKQTAATMPSFMKAWPISRIIGNSGLIDPFLTFNTEQLRNTYNSAAIAVEYGLTKKGRAAKMYAASEAISILVRLGAISTYNAIAAAPLLAIMQVASDMLDGGGDDDEDKKKEEEAQIAAGMKWNAGEKYELIRAVLPGHIHGGVQILRQLEDGKLVLTSGQRFDPSLAGALLEAAMYGDDESFEEVLKDAFFQLTPTLPALGDLASGTFNYLSEETGSAARDDAADEFAKGLGKLGESYTPGTWKTMMRTAKAADQGVELTLREKILNNVGMTVQIFDPARTAAKIAADYDNTHSRPMRLVREQMKEEAETLDFHSATVSKFTIWERAQRKMNNLRKTGLLDEGAIYTAVKSAPMSEGITEAEMVGLVEGMFVLPKYSEQVEKFHKEALVKAGTDQAKLDKVNTLYQTYYKQAAEADKAERAIYKAMGVTVL